MTRNNKRWLLILLLIAILVPIWLLIRCNDNIPQQMVDSKKAAPLESKDVLQRNRPGPKWRDHLPGETGGPEYVPLKQMLVPTADQGRGYWLEGKVTNEKGNPLQGAKVSLLPQEIRNRLGSGTILIPSNGLPVDNIHSNLGRIAMNSTAETWEWPVPLAYATSDADGRYQMESQTSIQNWVIVEKEGYATIEDTLVQGPGTVVRNYRMSSAPACIIGSILDSSSKPVPGAFVYAGPREYGRYVWNGSKLMGNFQFADGSGKFRLSLLPGDDAIVVASLRGSVPKQEAVSLSAGPCTQVDFRLQAAATISFSVKDRHANPIPNPSVDTDLSVWTDEHGMVEIAGQPDGSAIECTISAQGYKAKTLRISQQAPPESVLLDDADILEGQVMDEVNRSIGGAIVAAMASPVIIPGRGGPSRIKVRVNRGAHTDQNGMFSLSLSFPPKTVTAEKAGYISQTMPFEDGHFVVFNLRAARGNAGVFGRVVDEEGNPVQRFHVEILDGSHDVTSQYIDNEDGRFVLPDLVEGKYSIRVNSPLIRTRGITVDDLNLRDGYFYGPLAITLVSQKQTVER